MTPTTPLDSLPPAPLHGTSLPPDEGEACGAGYTTPAPAGDAILSSAQLLRGRKLVQIEHNGAVYMLRTTKLGKLILTK
ncbi:hemin uptake protein HemP [Caldimonas tepidiphila]|uniref:hemin uptake protein HemP n=1 Tax=Caldimonas tepidiphila TaxID=2315841 RepID=UPI000E5B1A83|nr:hemin uptake protein HemP [Caldimonas tepidiphila]